MYRVLTILARLLALPPLPLALAFGRGLGTLAWLAIRRTRERNLDDMTRCFPGETRRQLNARLLRVYRNLLMNQVQVLRLAAGKGEELFARIRVEGFEHAEAALAKEKGVLVLTAHIGNWDLMGLWAARQFPLTIISKTIRNAEVNRFVVESRAKTALKVVPAHNSYRACLSVLRRREVLGFMLDQNMTRDEGIFVDFFGKQACTTPGLAFLSAHSQAPVLPVFMHREPDGRHVVTMLPPVDPPAGREPATLLAATQHYTRLMESAIREHPDQWIWMHRRWATQPLPPERGNEPAVQRP